jgi:hypothetical protein
VNRRASLPGADELFRTTTERNGTSRDRDREPTRPAGDDRSTRRSDGAASPARGTGRPAANDASPEASGRVRHDQKITVYLTGQELLDLEQARLRLRAEFDLGVDRGRIVREAVAELLQELHEKGPDAAIVRRLS